MLALVHNRACKVRQVKFWTGWKVCGTHAESAKVPKIPKFGQDNRSCTSGWPRFQAILGWLLGFSINKHLENTGLGQSKARSEFITLEIGNHQVTSLRTNNC